MSPPEKLSKRMLQKHEIVLLQHPFSILDVFRRICQIFAFCNIRPGPASDLRPILPRLTSASLTHPRVADLILFRLDAILISPNIHSTFYP